MVGVGGRPRVAAGPLFSSQTQAALEQLAQLALKLAGVWMNGCYDRRYLSAVGLVVKYRSIRIFEVNQRCGFTPQAFLNSL